MTQYATFQLGGRAFGLDILAVREINRIQDLTPVPLAPPHIRGLINLRGQIVTLLDLGVRLGLPAVTWGDTSHNIILKSNAELQRLDQAKHLSTCGDAAGFGVDAIGDVVEADPSRIEPPSANVSEAESRFLQGVLQTDTGLLILLNLHAILAERDPA